MAVEIRREIRRYSFPRRLKARPVKILLEKALYWHSATTENTAWLAREAIASAPTNRGAHEHTVRRTNRMLHIVELCLIGLACGPIGKVLPVDRKKNRCNPHFLPRARHGR